MAGASSMVSALADDPAINPPEGGSLRLGAFERFLELHDPEQPLDKLKA